MQVFASLVVLEPNFVPTLHSLASPASFAKRFSVFHGKERGLIVFILALEGYYLLATAATVVGPHRAEEHLTLRVLKAYT